MKLYCVRHGEACRPDQDPHCPLTDLGRREASDISRYLAQCGVKIPRIIHSGKPRAQQTATIFANALCVNNITALPAILDCEADVEDLLALLPTWADDTMLVGHLPFMPRLVNALILGHADPIPLIHFPPATVVCLEQQYGRWVVRWILNPELVIIPSPSQGEG